MPPMPFSAVGSEPARPVTDPLIDAAQALADLRAFGVLWLDADLRIVGAAGAVPGTAEHGARVDDVLVALVGLDDELAALKTQASAKPLRIPNTAVMSNDGVQTQRLNVSVFWLGDRQRYLVLLGAIMMQGSPTDELEQEIRRRRLIEQDLASKSLEYARINQQLEEFAYVISHDLNAPLRALRYLSGDIDTALAAAATDGAAVDLGAVSAASRAIATQTRRMSKMLTDLLDYARIGRVQEAVEPVSTRALIEDIVASLRPTTSLALEVQGDWPTIDTAAAPLDLVLRNLVENAVKHHDRQSGRVTISAETTARQVVFRIADDGRGIAPEWQAAIFEAFRKIDDAHHPESSGIGLALVKKTVTALGGKIEVQSAAPTARGTTFVVAWPLKLAIAEDGTADLR